MKTKFALKLITVSLLGSVLCLPASAQGTAFYYQGQLQNNGSPANGLYDFEFSLSNAPSRGSQVGSTVTNLAVGVTNGLFTAAIDFGAGVFTGPNYWLAISVRSNGVGSYTPLSPLQELLPTPYSVFANTASNLSGTVSAGQLSGAVPNASLSGIYGGAVTLNNGSNLFSGAFTGNGAGLSNLNANNLSSGTLPLAQLPGAVLTNNESSATFGSITENGETNNGPLWVHGRMAIGPQTGGVDPQNYFYDYVIDNSTSGNFYVGGFYEIAAPTAPSTTFRYALLSELLLSGAYPQTGSLAAQFTKMQYDGSGYIPLMIGNHFDTKLMDHCTGTVGEMDGIQFNLYATACGMVTNAYNIHFKSPLATQLTNFVGNVAHLWLDPVKVGRTNYAMVINSDSNPITFGAHQDVGIYGNSGGIFFSGASRLTATNGFVCGTNYVAANFAPLAGMVILVASNNWMYSVTTLGTNRAFQISP